MRRRMIGLIVGFVLLAVVVFAFGLNTDSIEKLTGAEPPPGEHTLASGAFAADADTDGLCARHVERSILWQAYLAEHLRQPQAAKPVVRFSLSLLRNPGESPTVSATFAVVDANGKTIHRDSRETHVHRPVVKFKGHTIATLNPGEGDWRDAETFLTNSMVNIAAAEIISTPPQSGSPYVPALLDALRFETANAQHFYNADGQPITKYSDIHAAVVKALTQIGTIVPTTVPVMAGALADPDAAVRSNVVGVLAALKSAAAPALAALTARLKDEDSGVRAATAFALGEIGPAARAAIPDLVHALRDDAALSNAAGALRKIAPEHAPIPPPETIAAYQPVIPELIDDLKQREPRLKRIAANELGCLGSAAKSAAPGLAELLADTSDYQNREAAAVALQKLGADARPAVPALIEALKDTGGVVAYDATKALGAIGPGAKDAVPALIAALKDERILIRTGAAEALGNIGIDAKPATDALILALKDPQSNLRVAAAKSLGQIGPDPKIAVPALSESLNDEAVAKLAIDALGALAPNISGAVPGLIGALKHRSSKVRLAAIDVLSKLAPRPPEVSSALAAAMKDRDDAVRLAAAKAVSGAAGAPTDAGNIPALIDALLHGDSQVKLTATDALKKIGDAAVPALVALLKTDSDARRAVWPILAQLGPAGKDAAANAMLELYRNGDTDTRRATVRMLTDFGPAGAPGIPVLIECFKENDTGMSNSAREALKKLGPAATPALTAALKHKDERVRKNAANLLAELGVQAASSVPALIDALKDYKTAYNAMSALGKIGPDAKEAVPALLHSHTVLRIDDWDDAAHAIALIGSGAVPALIDGLRDSNARTRWMAAKALGYLGGAAQFAESALQAALKDKDSSAKKAAEEALAKIKSAH